MLSACSACGCVISRKGGKDEVGQEMKKNCAGVRINILVHNLLNQYQTQNGSPVWLPVTKGTGGTSITDHMGVIYCDQNVDLTVNPALHVQNGFLHFCCYESTETRKYNQVLLYKNATNRENKWRKMFLLLVEMLIVFFLLLFLPLIQEYYHWLLLLGSQYGSPSLTSMMVSIYIYHKTRVRTSLLVSKHHLHILFKLYLSFFFFFGYIFSLYISVI